ncbi:glycosyltransferase [Agromyces laixinhei]|uniref:glycosyltransferase n=1 Tax=Agromyces laixinhei TaxID=2585717 RepID=UPI0012ECD60C|nr:glycosyltransferase [Agromyces laixinhei]
MRRADRFAVAAAVGYSALMLTKAAAAALAVGRRRARLRSATGAAVAPSAVTIVQPILSGDPQLVDTLANTLAVAGDSPVLWLVDAADPEGRRAAEEAGSRHPLAAVRIVDCPPCPPRVGPKTFKLHLAESLIETDAFAVVDDDTRVTAEGLAALRDGLRIAEVSTGLPSYVPGAGIWSRLLAQFVNDQATLSYLPASAIGGPRTINGMTWAMRLDTLERIGGFSPLLPLLADDLAVATRVRETGGSIDQSEVVQFVSTTVDGGRRYGDLMHRWMVFATLLLRAERPVRRAGIAAGYAVPAVLLGALVAASAVRPTTARVTALAGTLALRSAIIAAVQRIVAGRFRHDPVLSLAGELVLPVQFGRALADRRIVWRGRRYLVHANDRFEEAPR